jgi:hypothetical protein
LLGGDPVIFVACSSASVFDASDSDASEASAAIAADARAPSGSIRTALSGISSTTGVIPFGSLVEDVSSFSSFPSFPLLTREGMFFASRLKHEKQKMCAWKLSGDSGGREGNFGSRSTR